MKEQQNIEWKESWRDEYLRWICGFANAHGGVMHIGRNAKGKIVGLPNAERLLEEIPNKVRDLLGIMVEVNLNEDAGKEWLEIKVEPYPSPISYKGEYHYRSGSTKKLLKGAALDRFLLQKQGRSWDAVPVPLLSIRDLAKQAVSAFKTKARASRRVEAGVMREPAAALIDKLNLVDGMHLKRAAVLLFHSDPERFIAGSFVKIGYFRSESDLAFQDEVHGDLFGQVDKTMELLTTKYLRAVIQYVGIQRIETFPVPEAALREAVLNAVIHRDYSIGSPIQIRVFDDRLLVWNPAQLPEHWTVAHLLKRHASQPYNPLIAGAFFRAGEVEAWGRGIQGMFESCRRAGSPVPLLQYEPGDLWVEFPFSSEYLKKSTPYSQGTTPAKLGEKLGEKWGEKWGEHWSQSVLARRTNIAREMMRNPRITIPELAKHLQLSVTAVENHIRAMREQGCIRRIGPAKGGHWQVN